MNDSAIYRHEARRCGPAALLLPVLVAAVVLLLCLFDTRGDYDPGTLGSGLVKLATAGLALAAGLSAATAVSRERMLEVQLTLPTPYPRTLGRRVSLVAVSVVLTAAVLTAALAGMGLWTSAGGVGSAGLQLLGPAAFPAGVAIYAAINYRSSAAGSTAAVAAWLGVLLMWNTYVPNWLVNTGIQLVLGIALAAAGLRIAAGTERLLTGAAS